ncbi:MAG: helix-hairpin-helix domain-containing protein [bacterium]|nr:helix-hairpin-helix domain-containing protein [bacterium]
MASEATLDRLFAEFDSPPETIRTVVGLLEENASPAFLARYRRWAIGGLPEERVQAIADRLHALEELEQRKTAIQQQAEERGSWTPELEATVRDSVDQDLIDDLYQSMRPRRRGPAMQMEEKGLAPLALAIQHRQLGEKTLQDVATEYLAPEQDLDTVEKVLEGALLILSDRISHDPKTRAKCRDELKRGVLQARAVDPSKGAKKYQDFFDFAEPIQRIPTGRMLALRRAEREKILKLTLTLPDDRHRAVLRELHAKDLADDSPLLDYYHVVFDHAWQALQETCGRDVRRRIKEKADREAVRTYARNLRSQLMAPPLGPKKVLAIRASGKGAWGVLLGEDGSVSEYKTLPLSNDEQRDGALTWLAELIAKTEPAAIAVPHGRRQAATEKLLTDLRAKAEKLPMVVPVDEAASTIFASGNAGKKAMPGIEVGVRTTVSLGRRLQDPLIELVRMDVRALGLGHVDDVHQGMLQRELSHAVSSCLAAVGIDLNLCDKDLLQQLPGVSAEQAAATLEHRRKNGGFKTRMQLLEVEGLDPVTVRNILGFLRLTGGDEPLDETGIHPDDYALVQAVAEKRGKAPRELVGENLRDVPAADFVTDDVTKERVIGVLQQLSREAEDPRGRLVATHNEGLHTFADLRLDSELKGRVTSLTEFGAFIDLGIGQDGLVHISQIPAGRLRDADNTLRVGEVVTVWVLNIDQEKKKISLAMMKPRHIQEGRLATIGERMALQSGRRQRRGPGGEGGGRGGRGEGQGRGGPGRGGQGRGGEGRGGDSRGRGGPRRRGPGEGGRDGGRFGGGGGGFGGRGRGPRDRGPQRQRVYTVEPGQEVAAGPNSKGEVTSLGNLGALFGGGGSGGTGGSGVGKTAKDKAEPAGGKAIEKPAEQAAPPVASEPPATPSSPPAPTDNPAATTEGEPKTGDQA